MNREEREAALEEALRRLCLVAEGVKSCVVVAEDGFALAASPTPDAGASGEPGAQLAAVSATLATLAERSLDRLAQGDLGRMLLEGEAGTLFSCPAGEATLALLVAPDASMGHVLFAAGKAAAEIENILART